jgi:hypothetical protein
MSTAQFLECPFCIDTHAELTRIAGNGEIDPDDPASARPELRAARDFLATITPTPDHADATAAAGLPADAVTDALGVNFVFGIIGRLANAFGFTLREDQLHSGTRSLHRFGYRFPAALLADGPLDRHGDPVESVRRAVLVAPAATDPAMRTAAATGGPLPEPWQSYAATVRDASYKVTDADIDDLTAAGHTEDEIFEITVAAAVGAALKGLAAGQRAQHGGGS